MTRPLFESARIARREGRLEDARRDVQAAVTAARATAAESELASGLAELGRIERDLRDCGAAAAAYEESAALFEAAGLRGPHAHALRHLGDVAYEAGDLKRADAALTRALEMYQSVENVAPLELANALRSLAVVRAKTAGADQSRDLWTQARRLYVQAGVDAGVDECDAILAKD